MTAAINRRGGRGVLVVSNLVFAAGLLLLGAAHGAVVLAAAWAVLGVAMALGLYDTAFAALTRMYGVKARGAITGILSQKGAVPNGRQSVSDKPETDIRAAGNLR